MSTGSTCGDGWDDLPHAPGLRCSRSDDNYGTNQCPADAEHHVIWDIETMRNGLCCGFHMLEAERLWRFDFSHPYDPVCSIAGAEFLHDENRCVVPDVLTVAATYNDERVIDGGTQ